MRSATCRRPPGAEPCQRKPEGETAVRKTGLLTAGRNPGDRTDPVRQLLTTEGNNVPFDLGNPIDKNLPHRSAQGIDYCTKKIVGQVERDLGVMQFNRDGIRVTSSNENG